MLDAVEKAATPSASEPEKAKAIESTGPSVVLVGAQPSAGDTKTVLGGHAVAQAVEPPKLQAVAPTQAVHGTEPDAEAVRAAQACAEARGSSTARMARTNRERARQRKWLSAGADAIASVARRARVRKVRRQSPKSCDAKAQPRQVWSRI